VRVWGVAIWGVNFRVEGLGCCVKNLPDCRRFKYSSFSAGLEPAGEREREIFGIWESGLAV
jgi:hypothetical protein